MDRPDTTKINKQIAKLTREADILRRKLDRIQTKKIFLVKKKVNLLYPNP